jgi:DNA-binding CsgD family transcriptional regulator/sugar-specific transcriptional regulator TrmB
VINMQGFRTPIDMGLYAQRGVELLLAALGLGPTAEQIYRQMLAEPDWGVAELTGHLGVAESEVRAALDSLFELSLIRDPADRPGALYAVSPEVGLGSALALQQAQLARQQQRVAEGQAAMLNLIADLASSSRATAVPDAEQFIGMDAVNDRLGRLAQEVESEILTFMPGGAQSAAALRQARDIDTRLLARGVRLCTIGLDSIRNDQPTLAHARFLTDGGGEFRTSPILPPRMIIADQRIAFVPIDPGNTRKGALALTGPGIVAALLALFRQVWQIATPLGAARDPDRQGLSGPEKALLELLAQGFTDEAAATRLGCSQRTARRIMADLMERLGARSRFEAGLLAARRGWL